MILFLRLPYVLKIGLSVAQRIGINVHTVQYLFESASIM